MSTSVFLWQPDIYELARRQRRGAGARDGPLFPPASSLVANDLINRSNIDRNNFFKYLGICDEICKKHVYGFDFITTMIVA
jgi:hypothetical protein